MIDSTLSNPLLRLLWLFVLLGIGGFGCTSDPQAGGPTNLGTGAFGAPCTQSEDCFSGLCVRVDSARGVCTQTCAMRSACPEAPNWECLPAVDFPQNICACTPTSDAEICEDGLDNNCDGLADDCRSCNGVAVSESDPAHCGECNKACRADQICSQQACKCSPTTPLECGGRCVDSNTDPRNCGDCGQACGTGEICVDGACSCPQGEAICGNSGCINLSVSLEHCGSCDNACTIGEICFEGECRCPVTGTTSCPSVGCVELDGDIDHCGSCGNVCAMGATCDAGVCVCPITQTVCNDTCVNISGDVSNCGECGNSCGAVQSCINGECYCPTPGRTACGTSCVQLLADLDNCGTCGNACLPGELCYNGSCVCSSQLYCDGRCVSANDSLNCGACGKVCPNGQTCVTGNCQCFQLSQTACGDLCTNVSTDENNCGACGTQCRPGEICSNGNCGCLSGQSYCSAQASCRSLATDVDNCGSCGNKCSNTESCVNGECRCASASDQWCASTGVCTDVRSSVDHCGACDNACRPTEACSLGSCYCPSGGQWCTSQNACVDTNSDSQHCGACDNACRPTEACSLGSCYCPSGGQWCTSQNACVDTNSDSQHCGTCDNPCPVGTHCSGARCTCDQAGLTLCGSSCVDLQADAQHCGACNTVCSATQTCTQGNCECPAPTVGAEVRLTANTVTDHQVNTAWSGKVLGVTYSRSVSTATWGGTEQRFALLDATGSRVLADDIVLKTNAGSNAVADVVWNGAEFGVAWGSSTGFVFQRIAEDGTLLEAAVPIDLGRAQYQVAIAWSPSYAGYALASHSSSLCFVRIGADGKNPDIPYIGNQISTTSVALANSPTGDWGVLLTGSGGSRLARFNPDGSLTTGIVQLTTEWTTAGDIIHDGTTWLSAWATHGRVLVHRGDSATTPYTVASHATTVYDYRMRNVRLAQDSATGAVSVGWSYGETQATTQKLWSARVQLPAGTTSQLTRIGSDTLIIPTDTVRGRDFCADVAFTNGGNLLAVWSDLRWGTPELYARPIDVASCP